LKKLSSFQLTRRHFLSATAALSGTLLLPAQRLWAHGDEFHLPEATQKEIHNTQLIYVSPLRSDGANSECRAEIWFVPAGDDLLICTPTDAWRSRSVRQGLGKARIWVGDYGRGKRSLKKLEKAPSFLTKAKVLSREDAAIVKCLDDMQKKYATTGWKSYGEAFRKGTKDGSRVVVRYTPTGT
jgi:hypothetical protein